MPVPGRRMTRVYNKTCQVVELQVIVPHADRPRKTIQIEPEGHIDVKSTEFNYDDVNPHMPATTAVFLGGSSANKALEEKRQTLVESGGLVILQGETV